MSGQVVIAGFSPTDKVPGAYGEVVYGAGGQSAASIPLVLLLVGLMTSAGNLNADTEVRQVYSESDIATAAGTNSELACMAYDALKVAPGVPMFLLSPQPANGATAATAILTITGTPTGTGTITVRIGGYAVGVQVQSTDTPSTIATNIANAVNGANSGRLPVTASAASGAVTFSCATAGVRGMQHVLFVDTSRIAPGVTASWYATWAATTPYALGAMVVPATANGYYYKCTTAGSSSASAPTWSTTIGSTVTDGTVTWTCWGKTATSSAAQVGVFLGNGTGTETYTNALQTIVNRQFDRIALAANDAVSAAAWKTQLDTQAQVSSGLLQHALCASNDALTAAQSLAQTTLNDQRFQVLWELNAETHPSRIAAAQAALATLTEQSDPAASYDGVVLETVVPQSQSADWPTHSTLVSALNTGVTPLFTYGDGLARICRSITSHCLSASNPDYSTLDTAEARCPDYVLKDLKVYWVTTFQPANPRVQQNPSASDRRPPDGVAYPDLWSAHALGRLTDMAVGNNPGSSPPILINVGTSSVTSSYDPNAKRIMSAVNVNVAPANHQIGVSVRQSA